MIFKFILNPSRAPIQVEAGARILSAGSQRGDIVVWAEVTPSRPRVARRVVAVPTGGEEPADGVFIDTVQLGGLVFHVYDRGEVPS